MEATVAHLADHIFVGESYNQAVFGRIVLVAVLDNKPFPRVVVRLSLCVCDSTSLLSSITDVAVVFAANLLTGTNTKTVL